MPKRGREDWNQQKYEQYLKEGRGTGTGKNYIPWIGLKFKTSHPKPEAKESWCDRGRC